MIWALNRLITKRHFALKSDGTSMIPLFQRDDVVYYQTDQFSRYLVNDCIMVKKSGKFFTHRVIYKSKNYLITKGDNNLESDGRIYPRQIIAKVYEVKIKKTFEREKIVLYSS